MELCQWKVIVFGVQLLYSHSEIIYRDSLILLDIYFLAQSGIDTTLTLYFHLNSK